MNLATIIEPHPPDVVALISRRRTTTYGELRSQVAALRGGLVSLGLEPGDRIGMLCGNNWYFVVSYLAGLGAGLIVVPLNPTAPSPEIEKQLAEVDARAVVVGPAGRASMAGVDRSALPSLEHVIASHGVDLAGAHDLDDLLASEPIDIVDRDDDEIAALLFTSGTAGSPKAAMLTHGNLRSNFDRLGADGPPERTDDVVLGVIPLFHIFGLNVVLGLALATGCSVVLIERFDPASALEAIKHHGVTIVVGPPTMWQGWANLPSTERDAMRTVRLAASGAAKLPTDVVIAIEDRFGVEISEGYGLTETSPIVASSFGTDAPLGSIGRPVPGVEMRLVDEDGEDVLVGDAGEIWVRSPGVFKGYWNDADATDATLTPDGWLRTGDMAVVNDDGYLFLVDRAKDLVIVSGFNVYPAEVEDVLAEHPGVDAVAVVGVPHPYTGEAVKAFVVEAEGVSVEEDELVEFCEQRLARYKCPTKVMFVDDLPQGLGGKVLRRALR
jgi:long-chain acyl-CoA synthetase